MNVSEIAVLKPYRMLAFQKFRDWFAEACVRSGIKIKSDLPLPWKVRLAIGKLGLCFSLIKKKKLLVCTSGKPEYFSWPWCYFYDLIPVVWDCWPSCHENLFRFIKKNRVHTLFCTASKVVELVKERFPTIDAVWLPEGIDVDSYPCGRRLVDRKIDVLELGRRHEHVHQTLLTHTFKRKIIHLYEKGGIIFSDNAAMIAGMRDTRISICFPHSVTHPERAGDIETMTQRYWEFMLTGALIVGKAPHELVEFCGYNPVVDLCESPAEQIEDILLHLEDYQQLVDKNREYAAKHASWDARMSMLLEHLK